MNSKNLTEKNVRSKINNGGGILSVLTEISELVQNGKARDVQALIEQALDEKITAKDILNNGLCAGMNAVGEKFKNNEIYVPEVLIAARAMNKGTETLLCRNKTYIFKYLMFICRLSDGY